MIMFPIDEAGAFDALSILQIKATHGLKVLPVIAAAEHSLRLALGRERFMEVHDSLEYADLVAANRAMWDIQELSMRDLCKASDVDKQNQARYHAKQALQRKFFSSELSEQKTVRPYEQEAAK